LFQHTDINETEIRSFRQARCTAGTQLSIQLEFIFKTRKPCNAPYIWMPWKISRVRGYAHGDFSRDC